MELLSIEAVVRLEYLTEVDQPLANLGRSMDDDRPVGRIFIHRMKNYPVPCLCHGMGKPTLGSIMAKCLRQHRAELAYINRTELRITLRDENTLSSKPNNQLLTDNDSEYLQLFAGQGEEVEFELPPEIPSHYVVQSELVLTGYYDRYSAQLARHSTNLKPLQSSEQTNLGKMTPRPTVPACLPGR